MRRFGAGLAVLVAAAVTAGPALGDTELTLGAPTKKPSAWATQTGPTWAYGDSSITETLPLTRPGAKTQPTVTFSWKLPATVPNAGADGELTIDATAGDQDVFAPAFSVNGGLVHCSGITNTPSYGSGCADGSHAAVGVSLQPGQHMTATQKFMIAPGGYDVAVTIITTGPDNVVYTYASKFVPNAARAASPATKISGLSRKVDVQQEEGPWQPASPSLELKPGDRLHTGYKAGATLTLPNGSKLVVKPMSLVVIENVPGKANEIRVQVWLRLGEVSGNVNRLAGSATDFIVRIPTTTASVRG